MNGRKFDVKKTALIVLVMAALIAVIMLIVKFVNKRQETIHVESGVSYIESRESVPTETVKAEIQEQIHKRMMAQLQKKLKQIENDEISVWTLFDGVMVMGDSRASGFSVYGLLTENQVIAHNGDAIVSILPELANIKAYDPSILVLAYGLNDVWNGSYEPEEFAEKYKEVIIQLKDQLPNTSIYISSIMKCTAPGIQRNANAARIPEYNKALKEMCEENGIVYIDNDAIADEYEDLFYDDGVHQAKPFYEIWAKNIITTIYSEQAKEQEAKEYGELTDSEQN
ncbi:MAG: SGNH/GDSL hydrolase family protein [Lachnospiraceae bacterium]|nr:SGNH/GDSL hydrolase family protein [Lachnospiraceae bacterium]